MPVDQLSHLEGCVSYRLDESISHRTGLTAYQLITNPSTIAADPDLPIYATVDALIRKLSKNHNAPAGTSRVLPFKDLDYSLQRHFRRHISHYITNSTLLVFDTPLVVSPMMVDPAMFDRTPSMPCLSTNIRKQLISRFPNKLRERQKSLLLGLPCVCRPAPTKSGLMRKSQAKAYAAARLTFLNARGAFLPTLLFEDTISALKSIWAVYNTGTFPENTVTFPEYKSGIYFYYRRNLPAKPTWENEADELFHRQEALNTALNSFARFSFDDPSHARVVRSRWPYLLRVLSWWHPYLPWLANGYPEPHTKYNETKTNWAIAAFRATRRHLFTLLRQYVPSHHFTQDHRLIYHRRGFPTTIPHPFTFDPTYPYPANPTDPAHTDTLIAYLNSQSILSVLPPAYQPLIRCPILH